MFIEWLNSIVGSDFACWAFGFAGGFEKAVSWSAESAAKANAVGSSVDGAEALLFNPAGLAKGAASELSINLSPTIAEFSGPIYPTSGEVDSEANCFLPKWFVIQN